MKNYLLKTVVCIGAVGLLSAGCSNEDLYDPDAVIQKYENAWEKNFGKVNPNQTWNTATTCTANVAVGYEGNYTIKIYTADPRKKETQAYLLGQFEVKEGGNSSSLKFDIPSALEEVYVALVDEDGGRIINTATVENGNVNVEFGKIKNSTRTIHQTNSESINITPTEDYLYYGESLINQFLQIVPEDNQSSNGKTNNIDNVTPDFLYKAKGEFIIYPMYHISSNSKELGLYIYEGDKKKEIKIWDWDSYLEFATWGWYETESGTWDEGLFYRSATDQTNTVLTWVDGRADANKKLRCQGIKISIPQGTKFGFYTISDGQKLYTERTLNPNQECYGATFYDNENNLYLSFEDWIGSDNRDFNDLVCRLEEIAGGEVPDIVTPTNPEAPDTSMSYLIACEDLGNTDDFDFNDIVFSVSHVTGTTEATVTPLAAGGTLEAHIYYNNQDLGEIHRLLGQSDYTITNTNGSKGKAGEAQKITVPADFSMSREMGGFKVLIKKNGQEMMTINAPANGNAPQMICIDNSNDWAWPIERTNISEAYPDFGEWGANYGTNADWYLTNIVSDKVVK